MRGKKPGDKLSMSPNALKKRRQRERAAAERARAAEADPGEATEPELEEPEEPEETPTEAELPLPPGARPEFGSPAVPSFEPLGDAAPPPGLSVSAADTPSSSTTRSSSPGRETAWHKKWRAQLVGGGGREEFVEYSADKVISLLGKLDDIIRQCGQKPLVTAESLRPAAVLTIDQMMPTRVDALLEKPVAHLVLGILAMGGQAAGAVSQAKGKIKRGEVVEPVKRPVPVAPLRSVPLVPVQPAPEPAAPVVAPPSSAPEPTAPPPAPGPLPVLPWNPPLGGDTTPAF